MDSQSKPGPDETVDNEADVDQTRTELSRLEIELCKQNFGFYDRNRVGSVERFELPMLLNGKTLSYFYFIRYCSMRILPRREEDRSAESVFG
jgi:hypothetical protein